MVVTVSPLDEDTPRVFIDEEYLPLLRDSIREEWRGSRSPLKRPVAIELALGWDAGIESIELKSEREDVYQASAALEAILRAHRRTVTGDFRLYIQDNGKRRRCFSCTARVIVTLKAEHSKSP